MARFGEGKSGINTQFLAIFHVLLIFIHHKVNFYML
ncbi:hypothetical protein Krac_4484 [Ktedonobacter racemifer DSM 44963]|uniref:Uncharacterized protein n=1 Tax=Ktedonobacter racemifer DSM 44963 TaxID=485913 RepID=D6TSW1_KTERA|nr:hypothetical protein Krac_4484 [Ktedonobacter racemifer DSM 44963]